MRFDALRILIVEAGVPVLRYTTPIECPNLRSLTVRWNGQRRWRLPPWIPNSLSELTLEGTPVSLMFTAPPSLRTTVDMSCRVRGPPQLGNTIQPSVLAAKCDQYLRAFRLIKNCVGRLAFPNLARQLSMSIAIHDPEEHRAIFPQPSDYAVLCLCLQQLCAHGTLERAVLNIKVRGIIPDCVSLEEIEARELAKVNEGFAGLLEANVLDVEFKLTCWTESEHKASVHCSLKRVYV